MYLPPGKYLSSPINLTSHMTLWVEKDATLLGKDSKKAYELIPPFPSYGGGRDHPVSVMHARSCGFSIHPMRP